MLTPILTIIIVTLAVALFISVCETASGYLGDSSLVPAILGCGLVALGVAVVLGFAAGHLTIGIN